MRADSLPSLSLGQLCGKDRAGASTNPSTSYLGPGWGVEVLCGMGSWLVTRTRGCRGGGCKAGAGRGARRGAGGVQGSCREGCREGCRGSREGGVRE